MSQQAKTRVLVTGATGFVGGHVLKVLEGRDDVETVAACRTPSRLPSHFLGEVRGGDLCDAEYRRRVVEGVDVICHAGTWSSFWGHAEAENEKFFTPATDLIELARHAGVKRFVLASTVVAEARSARGLGARGLGAWASDIVRGRNFWPHLERLIVLDEFMRTHAQSEKGMEMVTLKLGHFVGAGNRMGLVPVIIPRLKSGIVPWLGGGKARMPLLSGQDAGAAFAAAATAKLSAPYLAIDICGSTQPAAREVIGFIAEMAGVPRPRSAVPFWAGYVFAQLTELAARMTNTEPFLTRSLVYLSEDWPCEGTTAEREIGFLPTSNWRDEVREAIEALREEGFAPPSLVQA